VPLVSGVCRTTSAPKPSHGGSRLNASKPEANPNTRCPPNKRNTNTTPCSERVPAVARVPPPLCSSCQFGKVHRSSGYTSVLSLARACMRAYLSLTHTHFLSHEGGCVWWGGLRVCVCAVRGMRTAPSNYALVCGPLPLLAFPLLSPVDTIQNSSNRHLNDWSLLPRRRKVYS